MDMNGFCKPAYYNCGHHLVQMASNFEAQKHHIYGGLWWSFLIVTSIFFRAQYPILTRIQIVEFVYMETHHSKHHIMGFLDSQNSVINPRDHAMYFLYVNGRLHGDVRKLNKGFFEGW